MLPHDLFKIRPGSEHPFTPVIFSLIGQRVEDLHPQMAHADVIAVRKAERKPHIHLRFVFINAPGFAADIPGRLLHGQQVFFNLFF